MNTPAHLILGAALFARPGARWTGARWTGARWTGAAAIAGSLLPDLSLYVLAGGAIFLWGIAPQTVFGEMYFSDAWQAIFAIDHSIPLWSLAALLAVAARAAPAIAFAVSGWLHAVIDFLVHNDDARRQLWPLSDYIFVSPVSYWDPAHYGLIFAPFEVALCLVLSVILWRRFPAPWARALVALAMLAEASPAVMFGLMFAG